MKIERKQNHAIVEFGDGSVFTDFGACLISGGGGSVRTRRLGILKPWKPMSADGALEHVQGASDTFWHFSDSCGLETFRRNVIGYHSFMPVVCGDSPIRGGGEVWCLTARPGFANNSALGRIAEAVDIGSVPMPGVSFLFESEPLSEPLA